MAKLIYPGTKIVQTEKEFNGINVEEWKRIVAEQEKAQRNWRTEYINEFTNDYIPREAVVRPKRKTKNGGSLGEIKDSPYHRGNPYYPHWANEEVKKRIRFNNDLKFIYCSCKMCLRTISAPKINNAEGKCPYCGKSYRVKLIDTIRYEVIWNKYRWRKL